MAFPVIKVGPDQNGVYRYTVDGILSLHTYHNAASAKQASRQPQARIVVGTDPATGLPVRRVRPTEETD